MGEVRCILLLIRGGVKVISHQAAGELSDCNYTVSYSLWGPCLMSQVSGLSGDRYHAPFSE